jgi:hypothetical protein
VGSSLAVISYLLVGALVAALTASVLGRWRLAASLAGAAFAGGLIACVVFVGRLVALSRLAPEPARKAVSLSAGVSETANLAAVALAVALASGITWLVARRRMRRLTQRH